MGCRASEGRGEVSMELRRSKLNPKICQLARLPRFNLKVFKAIHHTYLRQANETLQRAPCPLPRAAHGCNLI